MGENKKNKLFDKNKLFEKIKSFITKRKKVLIAILVIIIVILAYEFICSLQEKEATITTKSSLEKILEISELSTIEYTYNAIATKYKDNIKEDKNIEYHVSYEGIVTVGIDFNEIKIEPNEKEKKIIITIPEIEKHDISVNIGTMEYMYIKNTDEKDSISQEAYSVCKEDLKERISKEKSLDKNARENAISAIEALFKPWSETYVIEFK